MSEFKFKPEDFDGCSLHLGQLTQVVDRANDVLNKKVKSLPLIDFTDYEWQVISGDIHDLKFGRVIKQAK